MKMYELRFSRNFENRYKMFCGKNLRLRRKVEKTLSLLMENPRCPSINSHKVNSRGYGVRWSSRVTGDLRVIWDYDESNRLVILVLSLGGHSGEKSVY